MSYFETLSFSTLYFIKCPLIEIHITQVLQRSFCLQLENISICYKPIYLLFIIKLNIIIQQMNVPCGQDGSCPFLYSCQNSTNNCIHDSIFPLFGYEYGIFSLFPFFSALCNLSGNTFGELKIILFMDLLNYQQNQSTRLIYPLVTGTALFNFFDLIFKRHPTKNTTLIDYNVVLLLIPNIILGSTIGALVNNFIPPIVADSILIVLMILFSIKFFFRYKNLKDHQIQQQKKNASQELQKIEKTVRESQINRELITDIQSQRRDNFSSASNQNKNALTQNNPISMITKVGTQADISEQILKRRQQLIKLQLYESGIHLPHILVTIAMFLVFQTLSFLAQGKIIFFSICSQPYHIAVPILSLLVVVFDIFLCRYTIKRVYYFKQIGYEYNLKIDEPKYMFLLCAGAFLGGFNGGAFGVGNSSTIIFTLIFFQMEQAVISATIGYQIVFAGAASMAEALATGTLQADVAILFFFQTLIIGGILTFILRKLIFRFNKNKVDQVLVLIALCLATANVFAMIVAITLGYKQFGASNMQNSPFQC